jgi:ribosomal protein L34E
MWDEWNAPVRVIGRCRECGDDIGTVINVRATPEWVRLYQRDKRLERSIGNAVVRLVMARHARRCLGRTQQRLALASASA